MYQGMVVLAASQVWWTWEVEDVFRKVKKGEKQAMKNFGQKMHRQIDELVTRITLNLSKNDRKKYNTVLIIDVHARDIVDSFIRGRWGPLRALVSWNLSCVFLWPLSTSLRPSPAVHFSSISALSLFTYPPSLTFQHSRGPGVWMGKSAAFLLGPGTRWAEYPPVHGDLRLRLRVHGFERTAGYHAPDGPDLPDAHSGDWWPGSCGGHSPGVMCFFSRCDCDGVLCWMDFPSGWVVKNLLARVGDVGSISWSGRSSGGGNGSLLQCSCLGNPMDRGAWWATAHGVAKSQSGLSTQALVWTVSSPPQVHVRSEPRMWPYLEIGSWQIELVKDWD